MRDLLSDLETVSVYDPMKAAQASMKAPVLKRFYTHVEGHEGRVLLDGKPVKTPLKVPLQVPAPVLPEVVDEWNAQRDVIQTATMPMTRLLMSVQDGVRQRTQDVIRSLLAYLPSDLLVVRAPEPEALCVLQAQSWDPVLEWVAQESGRRPVVTLSLSLPFVPEGVSVWAGHKLSSIDDYGLGACHLMSTLMGSVYLSLAVMGERLTSSDAWDAAHLDEYYQQKMWGEDAEAAARHAARRCDFDAACRLLASSQTSS